MARSPRMLPPDGKPAKSLGPLRMIWAEMLHYPRQVVAAFLALLVSSAASLAIPYRFKEIIDRAFILHDGAVLREGTPAEIVADAAVRRVYLGERFSL